MDEIIEDTVENIMDNNLIIYIVSIPAIWTGKENTIYQWISSRGKWTSN